MQRAAKPEERKKVWQKITDYSTSLQQNETYVPISVDNHPASTLPVSGDGREWYAVSTHQLLANFQMERIGKRVPPWQQQNILEVLWGGTISSFGRKLCGYQESSKRDIFFEDFNVFQEELQMHRQLPPKL